MPAVLNKILANQIDSEAVMKKLEEILHAVNPNLRAKVYFCNGTWRTSGPGVNTGLEVIMDGDDSMFKQMAELNDSRRYGELLKLCLAQIQTAPEWLTPRLFCALAYLGTGDKQKARAMLKEF
jgi:hypothetical protein